MVVVGWEHVAGQGRQELVLGAGPGTDQGLVRELQCQGYQLSQDYGMAPAQVKKYL